MQERALGGLTPTTRRLFPARRRRGACAATAEVCAEAQARAGAVLIREWGGVKYKVVVLEDGFSYRGQRRCSLSEIARLITGTHWSGHCSLASSLRRY
jgi:hypothetical protein